MADPDTCGSCSSPLPRGALGKRCPKCLLLMAVDADQAEEPSTPADLPSLPGQPFGDYELLEEIARGGMGVVFKARQRSLNRILAIKRIVSGALASPEFIQRFRKEAELAASLRHPNIVAVHEFGEWDGQPYFSMDFVAGRNLAEVARENPLPAELAARYTQIIAEAIQYAHGEGTLHRDLKPSNILIDASDQPRVMDFGLAKRVTRAPELTLPGEAFGSPSYMPPEQASGHPGSTGPWSDIYSLGAILYFLLTGRPPFLAETIAATLRAVQETEVIRPRSLNPTVPPDLETLCLKCLEKDPVRRFATAQEFADELGRFLRHEPIRSRPASRLEQFWRWRRRNPRLAALGGLALFLMLLVSLGAPIALYQIDRARAEALRYASEEARQRQLADAAVRRAEMNQARELFANDKAGEGLAVLAFMLRRDPNDRAVAEWILNELTHRGFPLPRGLPMEHEDAVFFAEYSPDGRKLLTVSRDNRARIWDPASGLPLAQPIEHEPGLAPSGQFVGPTKPLFARLSPDGTRIATGSIDKRARIWDSTSGHPLTPWLLHDGPVTCLRFNHSGTVVAIGCGNGKIRFWDPFAGTEIGLGLQHRGPVTAIDFSPDGKRVVSGSDDKTARIWEFPAGRPLSPEMPHADSARDAAFSPDGQKVVTVGGFQDRAAHLWDGSTGERLAPPLAHDLTINRAEFSPDGVYLATASHDTTARIWEAETGRAVGPPLRHDHVVRWIRFSPDAQRVATASEDGTARIWDFRTGQPLTEPFRHQGAVWSAEFSPDGKTIVTASSDRTAQQWDARPGHAIGLSFPMFSGLTAVQWSSDGSRLLATARTARLWDAKAGWALQEGAMAHLAPVLSSQLGPGDKSVATTAADGTLRLWDVRTGLSRGPSMTHADAAHAVCFSADGRFVATASADRTARIWAADSGEPLFQPLLHEDTVFRAEFDPESRRVATACGDKFARVWNFKEGTLACPPLAHEDQVISARFSPDGLRLVTASLDHSARVWDTRSGQPITPPLMHNGPITWAGFSPEGNYVATASSDGTARVWDASDGRRVTEPLRHKTRIGQADFSPDGIRVVTASDDGSARVWDVRSGQPLTSPLRHAQAVKSARFSPDGKWVATASSDWWARIWEVMTLSPPIPEWLPALAEAVACQKLDQDRSLEHVSPAALIRLQKEITERSGGHPIDAWAAWFFADRGVRAVSPGAGVGIEDSVRQFTLPGNRTSPIYPVKLRELLALAPTNRELSSSLARQVAGQNPTRHPTREVEAGFLKRRAVLIEENEVKTLLNRTRTEAAQGDPINALAALDQEADPPDLELFRWVARCHLLERCGQVESALASLDRFLDLAERRVDWTPDAKKLAREERAGFLARHPELQPRTHPGRSALVPAAREDYLRAHGIPPRREAASTNCIHFDDYFLAGFGNPRPVPMPNAPYIDPNPPNPLVVGSVEFDVRGLVEVGASWQLRRFPELPDRVEGIEVGRRARKLHFLHTAVGFGPVGLVVADYVIRFADGGSAEAPIVYGRDVFRWTSELPADKDAPTIAWKGPASSGVHGRFFISTWDNPRPEVPIETLALISRRLTAAVVLIAVTAEP